MPSDRKSRRAKPPSKAAKTSGAAKASRTAAPKTPGKRSRNEEDTPQRRLRFRSPIEDSPIHQPDLPRPPPPPLRSTPSPFLPPRRPSPPTTRRDEQYPPTVGDPPRLHGNTRAGRAERVVYREQLDRSAAAAARARGKKERADKEWEAEIAQFGEEEARRRRIEQIQVNRELEKLTTSDIDWDEEEERLSNPKLTINALLRVDGKRIWQSLIDKKNLNDFSIWAFEQRLEEEIAKQNGHSKGWVFDKITVSIKSKHSRAVRCLQTIDNFTETEWGKVLFAIDVEARQWKPEIDIRIEVLMKISKESIINLPSDPADLSDITSPPRRTRTEDLLNRQRKKIIESSDAAEFDLQLVRRWQCHDARCINHEAFCFIVDGVHYDLNHTFQRDWAKALGRGDPGVSIDNPPSALYKFLLRQGPVAGGSKKSKQQAERDNKDSFMSEYLEFTKKTMEMRMQERMAEQIERENNRMDNRHSASIPSFAPPHPSYFSYQYPQPWAYPPPPPASAPPPAVIAPPAAIPPPASIPYSFPSPTRSKPLVISSPIGGSDDEEDIMEALFDWKEESLKKQSAKDKWAGVRKIIENEMWKLDDLQAMADPNSSVYQRAMQLNIPDGWARGFKADIHAFKPLWRQAHE